MASPFIELLKKQANKEEAYWLQMEQMKSIEAIAKDCNSLHDWMKFVRNNQEHQSPSFVDLFNGDMHLATLYSYSKLPKHAQAVIATLVHDGNGNDYLSLYDCAYRVTGRFPLGDLDFEDVAMEVFDELEIEPITAAKLDTNQVVYTFAIEEESIQLIEGVVESTERLCPKCDNPLLYESEIVAYTYVCKHYRESFYDIEVAVPKITDAKKQYMELRKTDPKYYAYNEAEDVTYEVWSEIEEEQSKEVSYDRFVAQHRVFCTRHLDNTQRTVEFKKLGIKVTFDLGKLSSDDVYTNLSHDELFFEDPIHLLRELDNIEISYKIEPIYSIQPTKTNYKFGEQLYFSGATGIDMGIYYGEFMSRGKVNVMLKLSVDNDRSDDLTKRVDEVYSHLPDLIAKIKDDAEKMTTTLYCLQELMKS